MDSLVSTRWLADELGADELRVVDATWFMGGEGRDAAAEYEAAHIPGAVFMDLANLANPSSELPMMLPTGDAFARAMEGLGISDAGRIVLYDNSPYHSSARGWWMLRLFGARNVAILDGGFAKWRAEGRPVEVGRSVSGKGTFSARKDERTVRSKDQMRALLGSRGEQIVDARGAARFEGREAEPRPGVEPGHMPGAKNLPMGTLFDPDGSWKRGEALGRAFAAVGVDPMAPIAATCGSGMTACAIAFGAHLLGNDRVAVYDGSWSEWGADAGSPKEIGAAWV